MFFAASRRKNTLKKISPLRGDFIKTSKETAFYTKIFNKLSYGPPQAKHFGVLARFLSIFPLICVLKFSKPFRI